MKSYTDIEQSKKLAEILSLGSADMYWDYDYSIFTGKYKHYPKVMDDQFDDVCTPCWSLAALFDTLPKFIGDYGRCLYYDVDGYHCGYMDDDGNFMLTIQETKADNSVDACCDMIINLHKLSIL